MSIKIDRINHSMIREISYILEREVKDQHIKFVTITDVRVTNDLSYAKVYFTVLDEEKKKVVTEALNGAKGFIRKVYFTVLNEDKKIDTLKSLKQASGFIRSKLCERIDIRHMPELEFVYDESIAYGKKIEDKIKEIHDKNNIN